MCEFIGRRVLGAVTSLVVAFALSQTALSAPLSNADDGISDEWEFIAAPYILFANLSGDVAIGQVGVPIEMGFGDIVNNLDFAFAANLEMRKGRWAFVVDGQYMKLSALAEIETPGPILQPILDAGMKMFLMESFVAWRTPIQNGWLDLFGGIRYTDFNMNMTFDPGLPLNPGLMPMTSISPSWVSPIIGARAGVDLTENLYLLVRTDVGGFGAGSSFTWSFNGGFGYKVSRIFDLSLTFRYIDDDYKEGTEGTPDYFKWDMTTYGAMLGFVFNW